MTELSLVRLIKTVGTFFFSKSFRFHGVYIYSYLCCPRDKAASDRKRLHRIQWSQFNRVSNNKVLKSEWMNVGWEISLENSSFGWWKEHGACLNSAFEIDRFSIHMYVYLNSYCGWKWRLKWCAVCERETAAAAAGLSSNRSMNRIKNTLYNSRRWSNMYVLCILFFF